MIGPRSTLFCDYHAGYHAGHSIAVMRDKRAADPAYREQERKKVRARMRKLRADPNYTRPEKRVTS